MAKKQIIEEVEAVKPPPTLQEIANAFFDANPHYSSVIITEDGMVFENSQVGFNALTNHANAANPKLNFETFNR